MARIRTIQAEFFTSEDIVSLSPLARLLYQATWCEADKEGRMVWKPRTFKLRYFPADDCDIFALCQELVDAGLVVLYGEGLAYIPCFTKHQHINPRESASTLPDPNEDTKKGTRKPRVATRHDASAREDDAQGGREGKGKEGNNPLPPSVGDVVLPVGFEEWWLEFPPTQRKHAKAQCAAKWIAQGCDKEPERVLAGLRAAKASDEWTKDDGKFIPAPLVWLNQRRWEAFTEAQAQAKPGTPEYFAQHRRASWWQDAGFESVEDAHNNRCWHGNASEFINGTRGEP
jgi:hypothetical protein